MRSLPKNECLRFFPDDREDNVAENVHSDLFPPEVQGLYLKLFRPPKHPFSSTLIRPYALRFVRAERKLKEAGIPTVDVVEVFRVRGTFRHVVFYRPLEGESIRSLAQQSPQRRDEVMAGLARFLALLHAKGIYFSAFHLGHVLLCPDQKHGLIDMSATRFYRRPLGPRARANNLEKLLGESEDLALIEAFGPARFADAYLAAAALPENHARRYRRQLAHLHPCMAGVVEPG